VKKDHYGIYPSSSTITIKQYVNNGMIGTSSVKCEEPGKLAIWVFNLVTDAYETHVQINQFNGWAEENTRIKLVASVKCSY